MVLMKKHQVPMLVDGPYKKIQKGFIGTLLQGLIVRKILTKHTSYHLELLVRDF